MTTIDHTLVADVVRLSRKSGVSVVTLPPADRDLLLLAFHGACAGRAFPVGERVFSGYVAEWLEALTGLIRTDVAEFRRLLVDLGVFERDPEGRAYRPASPPPGSSTSIDRTRGLDLTRLIIETRAAERSLREARRLAHSTSGRASGRA
jgi:hypothetical protein